MSDEAHDAVSFHDRFSDFFGQLIGVVQGFDDRRGGLEVVLEPRIMPLVLAGTEAGGVANVEIGVEIRIKSACRL